MTDPTGPDQDATLPRGAPNAAPRPHVPAPRPALPDRSASLPRPGETIGGCTILRELARGGQGAVYVARDGAQREVALKVMLRSGASERFQQEARAAAHLDIPGVVGIHDLGVDGNRWFMVMDLIPGESLADRLHTNGPLDPREAARIVRDLARTLHHAHERGIVHRDMKPPNVLLTPNGHAVITDFGVAKVIDQSQVLSQTGQLLGTPAYMSPEQARGKVHETGPAADTYALGATLFAALTGRPPFREDLPIALVAAVVTRPADPPSTYRPDLDAALDAICLRCLEKKPDDRYANADALADDLDAYLRGEPVQAAEQLRRARALQAGLAMACALVLILVLGIVLSSGDAKDGAPPAPTAKDDSGPVVEKEQRAEAPQILPAEDFDRSLDLDGEGFAQLRFHVTAEDQAMSLVLEAPPEGDWDLTLDLADPSAEGERPRHRTLGGGRSEKLFVLTRETVPPLVDGVYVLQVRGLPGARAVPLRGRFFTDREAVVPAPLVFGFPQPEPREFVSPTKLQEAEAAWREAQGAESIEDRRRALSALHIIASNQSNPLAPLLPAWEQARQGGFLSAKHLVGQLAEDHPDNPHVQWIHGRALTDGQDYAEAIVALERAVRACPEALEARLWLARAAIRGGHQPTALRAAVGALNRSPGDIDHGRILAEVSWRSTPPRWHWGLQHWRDAFERFHGRGKVLCVERASRILAELRADPQARLIAAKLSDLLLPVDHATLENTWKVDTRRKSRFRGSQALLTAINDKAAGLRQLDRALGQIHLTRTQRQPLIEARRLITYLPD